MMLLLALGAAGPAAAKAPAPLGLAQGCALWQATERQVRDSLIPRALARRRFVAAYQAILQAAPPAATAEDPAPAKSRRKKKTQE